MGDAFKKVKRGDPLAIPAATFNTFVDAARDFLARSHQQGQSATPTGRHQCTVLVRNDSGSDRGRYELLGVGGPLFDPGSYEDAFKNHPAVTGVTPVQDEHRGRFVILLEPVASGQLGRALTTGVVPARVDVPDEDYPYAYAEVADSVATHLLARQEGSASILWREGGTGLQWALVELGPRVALRVFPVSLSAVGGGPGDAENPPSWTYEVTEVETGAVVALDADPSADPHQWARPATGPLAAADFGYAHWDADGQLVIGWINEAPGEGGAPPGSTVATSDSGVTSSTTYLPWTYSATTSSEAPGTSSGLLSTSSEPGPGTSGEPSSSEGGPGTSGPATTTSSSEATTSSDGTIEHPCCPGGAPQRFGFSGAGFTNQVAADCTDLNFSGELVWNGGDAWTYSDPDRSLTLTCSLVEGLPWWELAASSAACSCSYASWEDGGPSGTGPDCGFSCSGGSFDGDCNTSGPPDCTGSVTLWPL